MSRGSGLSGSQTYTALVSPPPVGRCRSVAACRLLTQCKAGTKENRYDQTWKKGFFGTGYFNEGRQQIDPKYSYLKQLERKQVLSGVEKLQLLSRLEKAGLTLSKLEELKLLSTAENLGMLSLLERGFETDPGAIAAYSIPPLIGTIGALTLIPDDNAALAALKYSIAAVLAGSSVTFIIAAFALSSFNED